MSLRTAKVCLVGDFGVGKTSLANRFVHQAFSERYQTTVGVTIETAEVTLPDAEPVKLIVWDIAGSDVIDSVKKSYLRGAAGLLFVADGTRADTFDAALSLETQARALLGDVPAVFLLNKHDLVAEWALDEAAVAALEARAAVFRTSARTGDKVEAAFLALCSAMAS